MNKYLPSKKFLLIFISIIIALAIISIFSIISKPRTVNILEKETSLEDKKQQFMVLDSDNDNLTDWEEALWKTDPKNPDTDGDGTKDGDEINVNRDPKKTNTAPKNQEPNDMFDEEVISRNKKAETDFINLTATEKISRELFSQYIATRKIDSPLSEPEKMSIVQNAIANVPPITIKTYTEKELSVIDNNNNETLRVYSNSLANIIFENFKIGTENIEDIINDLAKITDDTKIATEAKDIFQRFTPLISKNQKSTAALLKLPVPKSFLVEHLNLLNSFNEIYQSLDIMQKSADDLISLVPILNHYDLSANNLKTSIIAITTKILLSNIKYSSTSDYGYQLFNVIMLKK